MRLITWSKILARRGRFPRDDEGRPYVPGFYLADALKDAVVFYFVKKDRSLESRVRRYLTKENLDIGEVANRVYDIVFERYPVLGEVKVPDRIYPDPDGIRTVTVEIFDLRKGYDVDDFRSESFSGVLEIDLNVPDGAMEKIRYAGRSFTEALIKMEMGMLEDHPLVEEFYQPLINEIREWEIPLRLGKWTTAPHGGRLLFFWRIKEVRERIKRDYGIDIRPVKVLYLPRDRATAGWSELRREEV